MRKTIVIAAAILCIVAALASEASKQAVSMDPATPLIGQKTLRTDNQDSDTHHTSGEESLISQVCKGCRIAARDNSRQFGFVGRA